MKKGRISDTPTKQTDTQPRGHTGEAEAIITGFPLKFKMEVLRT